MRSPHSANSRIHTQINSNKQFPPQYNLKDTSVTKRIKNYHFKLSDVVGRGGFSTVYKGYEQTTEELVAIKVVQLNKIQSPTLLKLLYSEVDILKSVKHPNILKCYDVYFSSNNCYIVTEYCNNGDLKSLIAKQGCFKEDSARKIVLGIFQGLSYLAEEHIIHRDLKAANVFIKEGQPKIADFGFAKRAVDKFKDVNIGSPLCMSPQGIIDNVYGCKTDVWAFGILLYELFHGKTPFGHCKTQQELRAAILKPISESIVHPDLPFNLKKLILKCLEIDVGYRISIGEIEDSPYIRNIKQSLQASNLLVSQVEEYRVDLYDSSIVSTEVPIPTDRAKNIDGNGEIIDEFPNFQDKPSRKEHKSSILASNCDFKMVKSPREPRRLSKIQYPEKSNFGDSNLKNFARRGREEKSQVSLDFYDRKLTIGSVGKDRKMNSTISNFKAGKDISLTKTYNPYAPHNSHSQRSQIIQNLVHFNDILSLLHYCRILFKTIKLCEKFTFRKLDYLGSWLFKILEQIILNIKRINKPCPRIVQLKDIVSEYTVKYKRQLPFSFQPNLSVASIQSTVAEIMSELQSNHSQNGIVAISYLVFFYDLTELLGNSIASNNMGYFTQYNQIQQFLQAKERGKQKEYSR